MVVEKDINGVKFTYENKDVLVFEPDPNQREPDEDERLEYGYYQFKNKTEAKRASKTASLIWSQILSGCPSVTDSEVNK